LSTKRSATAFVPARLATPIFFLAGLRACGFLFL
jgi:hypothetical protein